MSFQALPVGIMQLLAQVGSLPALARVAYTTSMPATSRLMPKLFRFPIIILVAEVGAFVADTSQRLGVNCR